MREFNFVSADISDRDRLMIFADNNDDFGIDQVWFNLDEFNDMESIWVKVGMFKSKGQARKNGHGGAIPKGFFDKVKRKQGIRLTIWSP